MSRTVIVTSGPSEKELVVARLRARRIAYSERCVVEVDVARTAEEIRTGRTINPIYRVDGRKGAANE